LGLGLRPGFCFDREENEPKMLVSVPIQPS